MESLTNPDAAQFPALHVQDPDRQAEHWNDVFFVASGEPVALKPGHETVGNQAEAEAHLMRVWEQEQVLLGITISRIEGISQNPEPDELSSLGITPKVLEKSSTLVGELHRRMGAVNDMGRSDLLLTGMAGLVVEEVAKQKIQGFGDEYDPKGDPIEKPFAVINAFAGRLDDQPELAEGRESELLLAAELLSEALRTPESVRRKLGEVAGIDAESLDQEFYASRTVQICDAIIKNAKPKVLVPAEGLSRKQAEKREKYRTYLQTALLTKYDVLFDMLEVGPTQETKQPAREILGYFIADAEEIIGQEDMGRAYELFAPIAFRYEAFASGEINNVRIWHASARSDMPKDQLGFKSKNDRDSGGIAQHMRRQSSDIHIGRVSAGQAGRNFGRITENLQLKARSDAQSISDEYDARSVGFHFEDAASLLGYIGKRLSDEDPAYNLLAEGFHQNSKLGKENVKVSAAEQVLGGLLSEIGRRLAGNRYEPEHEFVVKGASTEIRVDLPKILDELVLPVYSRMVESAAAMKTKRSDTREVVGVK